MLCGARLRRAHRRARFVELAPPPPAEASSIDVSSAIDDVDDNRDDDDDDDDDDDEEEEEIPLDAEAIGAVTTSSSASSPTPKRASRVRFPVTAVPGGAAAAPGMTPAWAAPSWSEEEEEEEERLVKRETPDIMEEAASDVNSDAEPSMRS